jgi:FkbM family methyltransferase
MSGDFVIKYGTPSFDIDVTEIAFQKCVKGNLLYIPADDRMRAVKFTDPMFGVVKSIFITDKNNNPYWCDNNTEVFIELNKNRLTCVNVSEPIPEHVPFQRSHHLLRNIQNDLQIQFGVFSEEYEEQLMTTTYLTGDEKVLEIGGNIGRNSLIIAYILNQNSNNNFVCLECCEESSRMLFTNKTINNLDFQIECSALSSRKLIQKGWDTICSDVVLDGYTEVNSITWEQLNEKYNIEFDTLVLDCEGAFYYILMDTPQILENVKLIIMENDYGCIKHKNFVDDTLKNYGFILDYVKTGGWGPCYFNFYEVWKKP